MPATILWNRQPLPKNALAPLPLSATMPGGWLKDSIRRMQTTSLLDDITAAYLLGDKAAQSAVAARVEALIADGRNPRGDEIPALMAYYRQTGNRTIPQYLFTYARALRDTLQAESPWDAQQAADVGGHLNMALWLYNLTGQKALLDLCRLIKAQAPDWMSTFHIFPQTKAVKDPPPEGSDAYYRVHGETIAKALKTPGLQSLFEGGLKNETAFFVGYDKLMRYHGAAHGLFHGNPLLMGANPSGEVEPGEVNAMMHSLHTLLYALGNPALFDIMEKLAYGASPAARGNQAANQLVPAMGASQGNVLPFAASLFMATGDGGLCALGYAPCQVRWRLSGQAVHLQMETAYPAKETVTLTIKTKSPLSFPLRLRIPAWAEGATLAVDGEDPAPCAPGFHTLERAFAGETRMTLTLPMTIKVSQGYHQSAYLSRGPLIYALPLSGDTPWHMALLPDKGFALSPKEDAPPTLLAYAAPVAAWKKSGKRPGPMPIAPMVAKDEITLLHLRPYGETHARIAQFPIGRTEGPA